MTPPDHPPGTSTQTRGRLLSLASAAAMGVTYVASKYALADMQPETFVVFWFAMSAVYALASLARQGRARQLLDPGHPWGKLAGIGVVSAASILLLFHALKRIDPALVSFYTRADNIFAVLIGLAVLRERLTVVEGIGAAVALAGSLVTAYRSGHVLLLGLGLCLLSSLLQGVAVVLAKMAVGRAGPLVVTFYRSLVAASIALLVGLAAGHLSMPAGRILLVLAGASLCGSFVANVAFYTSLVHIDLTEATAIKTLQPFFVIATAYCVFATFPTPQQLAGGALILLGILIFLRARAPRHARRPAPLPLGT